MSVTLHGDQGAMNDEDLESMMSEAGISNEADEDEAVEMIRRMSNASSVSQQQIGNLRQTHMAQGMRPSTSSQISSNPVKSVSLMVPAEGASWGGGGLGPGLGSIGEDEEQDDDDEFAHLGYPTMAGSLSAHGMSQDELRQKAEQADVSANRYANLVQHSLQLVSEVKSALYDADHAGQAYGAEVLLDEVMVMLSDLSTKTLVEAAQLQKSAEQWLGFRRKISSQLQANHSLLQGMTRRRASLAREANEARRAECDKLWRQIRDLEGELESMPPSIRTPGSKGDKSPYSVQSDKDPVQIGGLTLEGAHSLLRAFASVLRPHVSEIIPRSSDGRSPSEAVALEFLSACNDSSQQVRVQNSPPPLEVPAMKRCDSSPSVLHGDKVESNKPSGLLPLPVSSDPNNQFMGLTFPLDVRAKEEQQILFARLGESF